jgi:hypothetical protein
MIDYIEFVKQYTSLKKSKLLFILAGGGSEFSKLLAIPGASDVVDGVLCCYGEDCRVNTISPNDDIAQIYYGEEPKSIVSPEWVKWAFNRFDDSFMYMDSSIVVISSAYPTLRERKGDNRSWIMLPGHNNPKLILFPKETAEDRADINKLIHLRTKYERLVVKQVFSDLLV